MKLNMVQIPNTIFKAHLHKSNFAKTYLFSEFWSHKIGHIFTNACPALSRNCQEFILRWQLSSEVDDDLAAPLRSFNRQCLCRELRYCWLVSHGHLVHFTFQSRALSTSQILVGRMHPLARAVQKRLVVFW